VLHGRLTQEEAAAILEWPLGTVKPRSSRQKKNCVAPWPPGRCVLIMNPQPAPEKDWLENALRDGDRYLADEGFTASVLSALPHRRHRRWLRPVVLGVMAALAALLACIGARRPVPVPDRARTAGHRSLQGLLPYALPLLSSPASSLRHGLRRRRELGRSPAARVRGHRSRPALASVCSARISECPSGVFANQCFGIVQRPFQSWLKGSIADVAEGDAYIAKEPGVLRRYSGVPRKNSRNRDSSHERNSTREGGRDGGTPSPATPGKPVPRAGFQTIIAAEDPIPRSALSQFHWNRAFQLDGEVADASPGVEPVGGDEGAGWGSVKTAPGRCRSIPVRACRG